MGGSVAIVHGTGGNPGGNWFPWLASELAKKGFTVSVPRFPTFEGQSLDAWMQVFVEELGGIDAPDIVVGHSTGALFLLHLLARRERPMLGAFFVAGYLRAIDIPEYDLVNASFFAEGVSWTNVRANAKQIFVYAGDNDPYVPYAQQQELAAHLGVPLRTLPGGGHLNAESGFFEFPMLRDDIFSLRGESTL